MQKNKPGETGPQSTWFGREVMAVIVLCLIVFAAVLVAF